MKFVKILCIVLIAVVLMFSCASTGGGDAFVNEGYKWNFDDPEAGVAGWDLARDDFWDFNGTINLSRDDTAFGKPMLRVDVDFSADSESWWSEPKLKYVFSEPLKLRGLRRFVFDMYYNPHYSTKGSFKSKFMGFNNRTSVVEVELDTLRAYYEVGDYQKVTVEFRINSSRRINNLHLGIVGAVTDYNGPIFIDNMRLE